MQAPLAHAGSLVISLGVLVALVPAPSAFAQKLEAPGLFEVPTRDPEAQKKIDAATVIPEHAKDCTDEEKELQDAQRLDTIRFLFQEMTINLVDNNFRATEAYWEERAETLFNSVLTESHETFRQPGETEEPERSTQNHTWGSGQLGPGACRELANGTDEACDAIDEEGVRQMCRMWVLGHRYRFLGKLRCASAPAVMEPVCHLALYGDRGPCEAAEGVARIRCDMGSSNLEGPIEACEPPLKADVCIGVLSGRSLAEGLSVCDMVAPVGEKDREDYRRAHLQCLAIVGHDAAACPPDEIDEAVFERSGGVQTLSRGLVRFDREGNYATVMAATDTPALCTFEVAAVADELIVDRKRVTSALNSHRVHRLHTRPFLRDPDPFEAVAVIDHLCVPMISWEAEAHIEPPPELGK